MICRYEYSEYLNHIRLQKRIIRLYSLQSASGNVQFFEGGCPHAGDIMGPSHTPISKPIHTFSRIERQTDEPFPILRQPTKFANYFRKFFIISVTSFNNNNALQRSILTICGDISDICKQTTDINLKTKKMCEILIRQPIWNTF